MEDQLQVGGAERALARLVDDDLARQRGELVDDVPARLAAHEDAAARAEVADADAVLADPARAPALVRGQVGEVGAMALAGVDDGEAERRMRAISVLIGPIGARVSERS